MAAKIIDGKAIAAAEREKIKEETRRLKEKYGVTPGLAVILVGDDPASQIYVRNKKKACIDVGFDSEVIEFPGSISEEILISKIKQLSADPKIHGILVQLPLPRHINEKRVIESIPVSKDVDAFTESNVGKIMLNDYGFLPCTPAGIMKMLEYENIETKGKRCVVVGRSNIVGKPMAMLMLNADATVTVCHSKTTDLPGITRQADILVVAVGKAEFIKGDDVKDGAIVIDVGMNRDSDGKLKGDVEFPTVSQKASYITPVPGGVGPMTITMLLRNTLTSAERTV